MLESDVLIVGAGPGGVSTAIECAKAGLVVTLLESNGFPRDRPGETLHPGIEVFFKKLGVAAQFADGRFLRHKGHWVQWSGGQTFISFGRDDVGPWTGFQVWRPDLDGILLQRARELGVTILQPCRALLPIIECGRVIGVQTSRGNRKARFVVDASGNRQWLARHLNLNIRTYSPRLMAFYGYAGGECTVRNDAPLIFFDPEGWTWTARVRPNLYAWTHLSTKGRAISKSWLPDELKELKRIGKTKGADVTWRLVNKSSGHGFFLTGDAAAVLDPASSHGVLKAIMSGIYAAFLIKEYFNCRVSEEYIGAAYHDWVRRQFMNDVTELRALYSGLL
jgi:flavin-dependent dehydrogenase